jgi:RecA-family ATPase
MTTFRADLVEGFASWRRMLAAVSEPEARLKIFMEAAGEVAGYIKHGLERADVADELADMASAYLADVAADQIQSIIAAGFQIAEAAARERGTKPGGNGEASRSEPPPLPYVDFTCDLRPRDWLVHERIPARNVAMLNGEGSIGKSLLLMQLSAAVVLGRDWLGMVLDQQGPALFLSCEEDGDEISRRLEAVAAHLGTTRQDLFDRGLRVLCFAGQDAVLAQADHSGNIKLTPLFDQLRREALQLRPKLIVLDTVADVFAGKENDRTQTRQFVTRQRGLAIETDSTIVIAAHPSLTGIASDTGLSGSTAWHNSVRARMYFKPAPGDDMTLRVLEIKKNNYGPLAENILLRWKNGVYVVEPGKGTLARMAAEQEIDHLFLTLLRRLTDQGRNVSDKISPSYAPSVFANEPDALAAKASKKTFAEAMTRLFAARKIRVVPFGSPSKMRSKIVEAGADEGTGTATILPFPTPSNVPPDGLPTPSNGLPTGCAPTPPIPPTPVGRGKGALEGPPLPTGKEREKSAREDGQAAEGNPYSSDAEILKMLKSFAYAAQVRRAQGLGDPYGAGAKIDSGDYIEPESPDYLKQTYQRAWLKLSPDEQKLLATWRQKHPQYFPKPAIKVHVIGSAPAEAPCVHCRQIGNVKRIANAAEVGGKSETLHEGCAAEWFAKL